MTRLLAIPPEARAELEALAALRHSHPREAAERCARLIADSRVAAQHLVQLEAVRHHALCLEQLGEIREAQQGLLEAVQLAQALQQPAQEAALMELLARAHYGVAEYWVACHYWGRAVELSQGDDGDAATWVLSQVGLAHVYAALGEHRPALERLETAQMRLPEAQDPFLEATVLITLGTDFTAVGEFANARAVLGQSVALCQAHAFDDYSAESLYRLAQVDLEEGLLPAAERGLNAAIAQAEQVAYHWLTANASLALASVHRKRGDAALALQTALPVVDLCEQHGLKQILQRARTLCSELAAETGDFESACEHLRAERALASEILRDTAPYQSQWLREKSGLRDSPARLLLELSNDPVLDEGDLARAVMLVCRAAVPILRVSSVGFRSLNAQGQLEELCVAQDAAMSLPAGHDSAEPWRLGDHPELAELLLAGQAVVAYDAERHLVSQRLLDSYLRPHGVRSWIVMPVMVGRALRGVLLIEQVGQLKQWMPDDTLLARHLVDMVVRALAGKERTQYKAEIESLHARLSGANQTLEAQVTERTAELAERHADLQRAIAHLVQADKLASLGVLVAGVADGLHGPIGTALTAVTAINTQAHELLESVAGNALRRSHMHASLDALQQGCELSVRNLQRAGQLIGDFKQVAVDTASMRRRVFDLRATIEEVLSTFSPVLLRSEHQVDVNVPPGILIDGYPGAFEQVLGHWLNNSIRHGFGVSQQGRIQIKGRALPSHVELIFEDNGRGLPPSLHSKVFTPFFNALPEAYAEFGSPMGQGAGLGLYLVRTLVCGPLEGEVSFAPATPTGVRFTARLPFSVRDARVGEG